jgi:hypothetical protein
MTFLKEATECKCGAKLPMGVLVEGWDERQRRVFCCAVCRPVRPASSLTKDRNYYRQLPVERLIALGKEATAEDSSELALVLAETLQDLVDENNAARYGRCDCDPY